MKRIIILLVFMVAFSGFSFAKERQGTVAMSVDMSSHPGKARLWIPYPVSDRYQTIEGVKIEGDYSYSGIYSAPGTGTLMLYAEWPEKTAKRTLNLSLTAKARERKTPVLKDTGEPVPHEVKEYLKSTRLVPTDGKVGALAAKIVKGKKGILARARAVYDWVVKNTYRDPSIKGCGLGIVERTLAKRGGKCADISTVFVALARAAGVPARDVFGLRLGKKPEQDITGSFNCWAEFYLPGTGWVQVNPADVRKIMLKEDLDLKEAKPYIDYYFGAVDEYRIVLVREGRDMVLSPEQEGGPINYFMYPYAEVGGRALDYIDPKGFSYSIRFKEL